MKIIDFSKKGNVVRFYLGDDNCTDYYGDDWDDSPYDCNAGKVYDRFIKGYKDIAFPFESVVLEPCETYELNCSFCKNDMKAREVPCIVVRYLDKDEYDWYYDNFNLVCASDNNKVVKYYFGDTMEPEVLVIGEKE